MITHKHEKGERPDNANNFKLPYVHASEVQWC